MLALLRSLFLSFHSRIVFARHVPGWLLHQSHDVVELNGQNLVVQISSVVLVDGLSGILWLFVGHGG